MRRSDFRPLITPLLHDALDEGAARGLRRYYKHRADCPDEATLSDMAEAVSEAVFSAICERFTWDDGEGDE